MNRMILARLIAISSTSLGMCAAQETRPSTEQRDIVRIELREFDGLKRSGAFGFLLAMHDAIACELTMKGDVSIDDRKLTVYLPDGPYSLKNTGSSDFTTENTASCIAIDADADGKISDEENWYANLPIRISDRMFDIVAIGPDGKRIELAPSPKPLSGIVVGRKVPPFSYATTGGKTLTQDDFRGRPFLIDIWSVT
jgi:hypothetical protein